MSIEIKKTQNKINSRYQEITTPKIAALRGISFDKKPPIPDQYFIRNLRKPLKNPPSNRAKTQKIPRNRNKALGNFVDFGFSKIKD